MIDIMEQKYVFYHSTLYPKLLKCRNLITPELSFVFLDVHKHTSFWKLV